MQNLNNSNNNSKRKVFVDEADSYLGSVLCRELWKEGYYVIGSVKNPEEFRCENPSSYDNENLNIINSTINSNSNNLNANSTTPVPPTPLITTPAPTPIPSTTPTPGLNSSNHSNNNSNGLAPATVNNRPNSANTPRNNNGNNSTNGKKESGRKSKDQIKKEEDDKLREIELQQLAKKKEEDFFRKSGYMNESISVIETKIDQLAIIFESCYAIYFSIYASAERYNNIIAPTIQLCQDEKDSFLPTIICISSFMTWGNTGLDAIDISQPLTEDEYRKRISHPSFQWQLQAEKAFSFSGLKKNQKKSEGGKGPKSTTSTHIVAHLGIPYGLGRGLLQYFFGNAWLKGIATSVGVNYDNPNGDNRIPMIHVDDAGMMLARLIFSPSTQSTSSSQPSQSTMVTSVPIIATPIPTSNENATLLPNVSKKADKDGNHHSIHSNVPAATNTNIQNTASQQQQQQQQSTTIAAANSATPITAVPSYVFIADDGFNTMEEIMRGVAQMWMCEFRKLDIEECLLLSELELDDIDRLAFSIPHKRIQCDWIVANSNSNSNSIGKQWKSKTGLASNIQIVCNEFVDYHKLHPIKILLTTNSRQFQTNNVFNNILSNLPNSQSSHSSSININNNNYISNNLNTINNINNIVPLHALSCMVERYYKLPLLTIESVVINAYVRDPEIAKLIDKKRSDLPTSSIDGNNNGYIEGNSMIFNSSANIGNNLNNTSGNSSTSKKGQKQQQQQQQTVVKDATEDIITQCFISELNNRECKLFGYILVGWPFTINQAQNLFTIINGPNTSINGGHLASSSMILTHNNGLNVNSGNRDSTSNHLTANSAISLSVVNVVSSTTNSSTNSSANTNAAPSLNYSQSTMIGGGNIPLSASTNANTTTNTTTTNTNSNTNTSNNEKIARRDYDEILPTVVINVDLDQFNQATVSSSNPTCASSFIHTNANQSSMTAFNVPTHSNSNSVANLNQFQSNNPATTGSGIFSSANGQSTSPIPALLPQQQQLQQLLLQLQQQSSLNFFAEANRSHKCKIENVRQINILGTSTMTPGNSADRDRDREKDNNNNLNFAHSQQTDSSPLPLATTSVGTTSNDINNHHSAVNNNGNNQNSNLSQDPMEEKMMKGYNRIIEIIGPPMRLLSPQIHDEEATQVEMKKAQWLQEEINQRNAAMLKEAERREIQKNEEEERRKKIEEYEAYEHQTLTEMTKPYYDLFRFSVMTVLASSISKIVEEKPEEPIRNLAAMIMRERSKKMKMASLSNSTASLSNRYLRTSTKSLSKT